MNPNQIRAAMLATHGVFAVNENDWSTARQDFMEAYSLDPQSAFALNNRGYVAERDGDLETASSYYARAQKAEDARARVGMATQAADQGRQISAVADESHRDVDSQLNAFGEMRKGQKGQTELKRRNNNTQKPEASPRTPSNTPPSDSSTPPTSH
jgi:Flp pilus assembly protein TadD